MGNLPNACVKEVGQCVNESEQTICAGDYQVIDSGEYPSKRYDLGPGFYLGREGSSRPQAAPSLQAQYAHRPASSGSMNPATIVLPTIQVMDGSYGSLPDGYGRQRGAPASGMPADLLGRTYEAQKAGHIQNTIDGLLSELTDTYVVRNGSDFKAQQFAAQQQFAPRAHMQGSMMATMQQGSYVPPSQPSANVGYMPTTRMPPTAASFSMRPPSNGSSSYPGGSSRFCGECGAPFAGGAAKFCAECGSRRPVAAGAGTAQAAKDDDMDRTLARQGIILGKGSWAQAYRRAQGPRRDALWMLAMTGIVTERELADDLTVVGQDHINECIYIATEMLAKWPPRMGAPPLHEAKSFFQERLAQLHVLSMAR